MKHSKTIKRIRNESKRLSGLQNEELKKLSLALKFRAMSAEPFEDLVVAGFALVVEASRRCVQQVHYDVQLLCGIEMVAGRIAEMKTGEGKTLTAGLAAYLFAIRGKGAHVITFNDYLAERDCEFLRPVFEMLGLTVDVIKTDFPSPRRAIAYDCDITYGSAKEFGFDFLRDRLKIASTGDVNAGVMRGLKFALIDEADSVLIDEARTPLIIGMVNQAEEEIAEQCFAWGAKHASRFVESEHFLYNHVEKSVKLTSEGVKLARCLPQNEGTKQVSIRQLYQHVENAAKVLRDFQLDKSYAIVDEEIVIIDEFTGRPSEGRQWQNGIHQAVQAKEGLKITPATKQAASVTIQSFFKHYHTFCGMTGTAWTSRREIKKVYKKQVGCVPTHKPILRTRLGNRVFSSLTLKFEAIAQSTLAMTQAGRAVLIGTRSVRQSERLADCLQSRQVNFEVLNARHLDREAELVELAGQTGRVTVATNMAGRGTDIKLADSVRDAGGLHVILSEIHESARIDWQMIGRGARQGDPGSYQIFVSLEDEILRIGFGVLAAKRLQEKHEKASVGQLNALYPVFLRAQKRTEKRYLTDRLMVLKQDIERQKSLFDTGQDPYLNVVRN